MRSQTQPLRRFARLFGLGLICALMAAAPVAGAFAACDCCSAAEHGEPAPAKADAPSCHGEDASAASAAARSEVIAAFCACPDFEGYAAPAEHKHLRVAPQGQDVLPPAYAVDIPKMPEAARPFAHDGAPPPARPIYLEQAALLI